MPIAPAVTPIDAVPAPPHPWRIRSIVGAEWVSADVIVARENGAARL
jgi:hypothetical protein